MTTPEDPKLEKYINEVKWRRAYSKAYYSKKKAQPPTEEEKEEKLIERAKNLMEQRKTYNARARAKTRAYKEATVLRSESQDGSQSPKRMFPSNPEDAQGSQRQSLSLLLRH